MYDIGLLENIFGRIRKKDISNISDKDSIQPNSNIVKKELVGDQGKITFNMPVKIAQGSVRYRYDPSRGGTRFNSSNVAMYDIDDVPSRFNDQIPIVRDIYLTDPITATVIDVLTQFSYGEFENVHEDAEIKNFFDAIKQTSNLDEIRRNVLHNYYLLGNSFPYRSVAEKKVIARNGVEVPLYSWTVLNPERIDVQGTLLFNQSAITLEPNQELTDIVNSNDPALKKLVKGIDSEIVKAVKDGENIVLDPNKVYHVARNKMPYERYATPFIMRNLTPIRVKRKLYEMDLSTADGIINQLVTITVGDKDFPATQEDLDKIGDLVENPNKAYTLIWNHTLTVKFHKPEANLFDPKKYQQVNEDILAGYGIVRQIVSNENSSYAGQAVSIKSLVEWLDAGRADVRRWIEREYEKIAEENGLDSYPEVKFKKINVNDEKSMQATIFNLYDRGIVSAESVLGNVGYSLDMEVDRMRDEKELQKEGLLIPQSPWQQSKDQPNPIGNPPQSGDGRPEGVEDKEQRERDHEPDPHGTGTSSFAPKIFESVAVTDREIEYRQRYTSDLFISWERMKERITEGLPEIEDRDSFDALIDGAILAFISESRIAGIRHITQSFTEHYENLSQDSIHNNDKALVMLQDVIDWDTSFKKKLENDLRIKLTESYEEGFFDDDFLSDLVDGVFISMQYRLPLFGNEGIKKSRFCAEVVYVEDQNIERGTWQAKFRNTCEYCAELHGKSFTTRELLDLFPAHVNCECSILWQQPNGCRYPICD